MKILAMKFILEANAHVPMKCDIENVALSFGNDALKHMQLNDVFTREDIQLISVLCADAGCSGVMKKDCFMYIENRMLQSVKEHRNDLDGIYLHLHGASEIEEMGSGDHHIVASIRALVGPYLPIAVVCDPHGNLCKEYVENTTIIRSYREAPHIDIEQTIRCVGRKLISILDDRKQIKPIYRKLPLILGGEQSVSADEPVCSINQYMNEIEMDERIMSVSWHVGYLRHDTWVAGCGIVVVPSDKQYAEYANTIADDLAAYVFAKRHEFHYTGLTLDPTQAIMEALACDEKPVFISDSGDNVTSGAMGANTYILRQFLEEKNHTKRILIAAIHDATCYAQLEPMCDGAHVEVMLGMGLDEMSAPVLLKASILHHGRQEGTIMYGEEGDYGGIVTLHIDDSGIDIAITHNNHSFVELHQLTACGINVDDYDIIVVKQGYIHPELKEKGKRNIMSLTDGATLQDTKRIPFKQIMRPMYPIDDI